jgi:hypothetical protein
MRIKIKFDQKLKQVNMMMRGNKTTIKKFEYKLDQTFKIIMHAHDDAFLPFLIVTFMTTMGISTSEN